MPRRLLTAIAATLGPGGALRFGIDLVKDWRRIEAACNGSQGVTLQVVRRNGLDAINRELRADLGLEAAH